MRFTIVTYLLLQIVPNLLLSQTHVGGDIDGGVWDLEGSPYIVDETVRIAEGAELVIEPGVRVMFSEYTGLSGRNVTFSAEGTQEDSIWFVRLDRGGWRSLSLSGPGTDASFAYCYFSRSFGFWQGDGVIINARSLEVRHCTFINVGGGISVGGVNYVIEDCLFENIAFGAIMGGGGDSTVVSMCVFLDVGRAIRTSGGFTDRCIFGENSSFSGGEGSRVSNSIFIGLNTAFSDADPVITNNLFFDCERLFDRDSLDGVGVLDRVNTNGDSTDVFGNLFMDPLLAMEGDYPDFYFPNEESPIIDAGDPEGDFDPDSTIADIGAFFFPQANIRLDRYEVEFTDIQTGTYVEAELTVRNVGVEPLWIDDITIAQEGRYFGFDYEWEDILPDSSALILIFFSPDVEDNYEAVLSIESNDRNEPVVEVSLVGNALSVDPVSETLPTEFGILSAYPNPFNSKMRIEFSVVKPGEISLNVYSVSGNYLTTLLGGNRQAGIHKTDWDASEMPTGIYILRLESTRFTASRKVVLVK